MFDSGCWNLIACLFVSHVCITRRHLCLSKEIFMPLRGPVVPHREALVPHRMTFMPLGKVSVAHWNIFVYGVDVLVPPTGTKTPY